MDFTAYIVNVSSGERLVLVSSPVNLSYSGAKKTTFEFDGFQKPVIIKTDEFTHRENFEPIHARGDFVPLGLGVGLHNFEVNDKRFSVNIVEDDPVLTFGIIAGGGGSSPVSAPVSSSGGPNSEAAVYLVQNGTSSQIINFPAVIPKSIKQSIDFVVSTTAGTSTYQVSANASGVQMFTFGNYYFDVEVIKDTQASAAMIQLASITDATHIAVKTGNWFDTSTWMYGVVPTSGANVYIPKGRTITYAGSSDAGLNTVRNDGTLIFAASTSNFMRVHSLINNMASPIRIGTLNTHAIGTEIKFINTGDLDPSTDPTLVGKGFLTMGPVSIYGQEKTVWKVLSSAPTSGATRFEFTSAPENWRINDTLVVTGVNKTSALGGATAGIQRSSVTEDEIVVITTISNNYVNFTPALVHNHVHDRDVDKSYVANFSRTVRFITEAGASVPVQQRAHSMHMMTNAKDIRYAEFQYMGRTDKSTRAFDFNDVATVSAKTNFKGRYSLHLHQLGVSAGLINTPVILAGNAVFDSPGWGFVQHESIAMVGNNAAYGCFGACYVAEGGNEVGRWTDNIAINSLGVGGVGDASIPKVGGDVAAVDNGRTGAGYFYVSRNIENRGNIAAGMPSGHGFAYMHRMTAALQAAVDFKTIPQPETMRYYENRINYPHIPLFEDNVAHACMAGFMVVKNGPVQNHDARTHLNNFRAINCKYGGFFEYTGHYTISDWDVYTNVERSNGIGTKGIHLGPNAADMLFHHVSLENLETGVYIGRNHTADMLSQLVASPKGDNYVFAGISYVSCSTSLYNTSSTDEFYTSLTATSISITPDKPLNVITSLTSDISFGVTKVDGVGSYETSTKWDRQNYNLGLKSEYPTIMYEGYHTVSDNPVITYDQIISDRVAGKHKKISNVVQWTDGTSGYTNRGVLDFNGVSAVVSNTSVTVCSDSTIDINLLALASQVSGKSFWRDGHESLSGGWLSSVSPSVVRYHPDHKFTGNDVLEFWIKTQDAKFTKGTVDITVI